tara:strand:- start:15259 stop:16134 length:876 start_codon:yes stop_codon:yes gene_type:complete
VKQFISLLLFIVIPVSVHAKDLKPNISGKFDVGGFSLYLECYGTQQPTVVLESGFGGYGSNGLWNKVITEVSPDSQVCVYDRAGLGRSDAGPVPFSSKDVAERLHGLLATAEINEPFILVSHSYGSYHLKMFNALYGESVLAALFVDPTPFGLMKFSAENWPAPSSSDTQEVIEFRSNDRKAYFDPSDNPETMDFEKSYEEVASANDFGAKPLIVIKATREIEPWGDWARDLPPEVEERNRAFLTESDELFLALSENSEVITAETTEHNIHWHEPKIVIENLRALINKVSR